MSYDTFFNEYKTDFKWFAGHGFVKAILGHAVKCRAGLN